MIRPKKPPHGSACNHCGLCCQAEPCPIGAHYFDMLIGTCPALMIDVEGKSSCGFVTAPEAFAMISVLQHGADVVSDAALTLISSSGRCDACFSEFGEPPNLRFELELNLIMFADPDESFRTAYRVMNLPEEKKC